MNAQETQQVTARDEKWVPSTERVKISPTNIKQSESYQMFIKYSTGQIPPKKSRGKGSQGKKTAYTHVVDVDQFEESDSEPAKKRTASRRVLKNVVILDLMIQKSNRMKQKDQNRHCGTLQAGGVI
nr:hypothetical protein [Tanacetum cinerariifolium]